MYKWNQKRTAVGDLRRGSVTVEASFVVPFTFFLLAALITMLFYVHDAMYYRCAACETAISGNAPGQEGGETQQVLAERTAALRIEGHVMPAARPEYQVRVGSGKTTVIFARPMAHTWFGTLADAETEMELRAVRPERVLRMRRAAEQLKKQEE